SSLRVQLRAGPSGWPIARADREIRSRRRATRRASTRRPVPAWTAVADGIERADHLRRQCRISITGTQNNMTQSNAACLCCERGERGERFECDFDRGTRNGVEMIEQPD